MTTEETRTHTVEGLREGIPIASGGKVTIVVKSRITTAIYDAVGGPAVPRRGSDGSLEKPTESGQYVIVGMWKHVSKGRWPYSMIAKG